MIIKICGIVFIIISSYAIGAYKAYELENRISYLESMEFCVMHLNNEIRYTQTPIFSAFKRISENSHTSIKSLFDFVIANENSGNPISDIWAMALENSTTNFPNADKQLFLSFGQCICNTDIEGQIQNINLFNERLKQTILLAKQISEKNRKLYKNLGLYSGILLSVLLI